MERKTNRTYNVPVWILTGGIQDTPRAQVKKYFMIMDYNRKQFVDYQECKKIILKKHKNNIELC